MPSEIEPVSEKSGIVAVPRETLRRLTGRGSARSERGGPMGFFVRSGRHVRRGFDRVLELVPVALAVFMVSVTWSLLPRPLRSGAERVDVGTIATQTVIADRALALPDEAATRALQSEARRSVLPVFDLDRALGDRRRKQMGQLFAAGRQLSQGAAALGAEAPTAEERLARLTELCRLRMTASQEALFFSLGYDAGLEDQLSEEISRILRQGVVSDEDLLLEHRAQGITLQVLPSGERKTELDLYRYLDYPDEVRETALRDLRLWSGLDPLRRQDLVAFLVTNLAPNLTPNNSETLELRRQAAAQVGTVTRTIPEGQVVVRRGDRVDPLAALALEELAGGRDASGWWTVVSGIVLLLLAVATALWLGLAADPISGRSRARRLSECLLLISVQVLGVRFAFFVAAAIGDAGLPDALGSEASYRWAVPMAALAMIAALLYGRRDAIGVSLVFSLLAGWLGGGETRWMLTVYSLTGSLAAVFALERLHFKQRTVTATAGLLVGAVNAFAVLTLTLLGGQLPALDRLGFDLVCAFAGGLLAAAITSFSVPVLETWLGATTHIKLIELANPNLRLLRRLALEAPGTFQHSLAVANLAKAGCEAIDADAVLVNTGALYHDIGKLMRPQYFIENQPPSQNPHDKIQPSMSALILINHVKDGLEMAHRHRLPTPLRDAIAEHHGTRLITFFHCRAVAQKDPDTEAVSEDDFRYPGPKPKSKETGVLMLADAVEAASRTLVEPSRQKIRTMLRQIFDDCLADRQLDHTDLTLGDLRRVEEAFLHVLVTIYHRRIDYPGFDFNQPRRKRASQTTPEVAVAAS